MSDKKVTLVTGAARGIGAAIALTLAEPGTEIVVNDVITEEDAKPTLDAIRAKGAGAHFFRFDVADETAVKEGFTAILDKLGRLDVLVNNAGITRDALMARMKPEAFDLVLRVNLRSVFLCSQAALKPMLKQRFGRIVSIASVVGVMGNVGQANYAASKAGIIGITKSLAREVISRNITVNAIAPGFIDSEMTRSIPEKERDALLSMIPAQRYGQPEDVANAVKFFTLEENGYITGQVLHVNGGMLMI